MRSASDASCLTRRSQGGGSFWPLPFAFPFAVNAVNSLTDKTHGDRVRKFSSIKNSHRDTESTERFSVILYRIFPGVLCASV